MSGRISFEKIKDTDLNIIELRKAWAIFYFIIAIAIATVGFFIV